ncbi:MAG: sigma factor-like helix-turn-helix DNA-binding protein [Clostridia bacterium]|jgi:RNA polymerase sigma factor (sigma-70 family)
MTLQEINSHIEKVKVERDDDAFEALLKEFDLLFYAVSWKFHSFCDETIEDFAIILKSHFFFILLNYEEALSQDVKKYLCSALFQVGFNLADKKLSQKKRLGFTSILENKESNCLKRGYEEFTDLFRIFCEDNLNKEEQYLLKLYFEVGHTQEEIGKLFNLNQSTISFRLSKLLAKLKESFVPEKGKFLNGRT